MVVEKIGGVSFCVLPEVGEEEEEVGTFVTAGTSGRENAVGCVVA